MITPRSRLTRCLRHKGGTGNTCSIVLVGVPKTFSSSSCPVTGARVPGVCSRRSDRRRQSRPHRARRHLFDPRLVAKLRSPHRPGRDPPFFTRNVRPGGPLPPAVPDAPAVWSRLAPLPPVGGSITKLQTIHRFLGNQSVVADSHHRGTYGRPEGSCGVIGQGHLSWLRRGG